jgi:hypothetical protein
MGRFHKIAIANVTLPFPSAKLIMKEMEILADSRNDIKDMKDIDKNK